MGAIFGSPAQGKGLGSWGNLRAATVGLWSDGSGWDGVGQEGAQGLGLLRLGVLLVEFVENLVEVGFFEGFSGKAQDQAGYQAAEG